MDKIFEETFSVSEISRINLEKRNRSGGVGIDGMAASAFQKNKNEHIKIASKKVLSGEYRFTPYKQILKTKGKDKKPREISIPTQRDRLVLSGLKEYLHKVFPEVVNRSLPNQIISNVLSVYRELNETFCFKKIDIKEFYPSIKHELLINLVKSRVTDDRPIELIQNAIETATIPVGSQRSARFSLSEKGVPQGLSISNILADIYVSDLDFEMKGIGSEGSHYFRFVDDILLLSPCDNMDEYSGRAISIVVDKGLSTNEKVEVGNVKKDAFEYLGYQIDADKVTVREKSQLSHIKKIIDLFVLYRNRVEKLQSEPEKIKNLKRDMYRRNFLHELNTRITGAVSANKRYGWIFYFMEIDDRSLMHMMDRVVKEQIERFNFGWIADHGRVKRHVKAYYSAIAPLKGYFLNYDKIEENINLIDDYLVKFGYFIDYDQLVKFSPEERIERFRAIKNRTLSALEKDVGDFS